MRISRYDKQQRSSFAIAEEELPASSSLIAPEQPYSIPQLIQAPIPNLLPSRQPICLIACGIPQGVNGIVHQLHVLGFTEVLAWSPPLPSPIRGEILRILTRHVRIEG